MPRKTAKDLQNEIDLMKAFDEERRISDEAYARKFYEKAINWFIALVMAIVISAIVYGVIKQ
jgi:hypothetical protein